MAPVAKPAPASSDEGMITQGTIGRINVELGDNTVCLRLFMWALSPLAVLERGEVDRLIEKLTEARSKLAKAARASAIVAAAEDDDDLT